jgi:2-alkyl-3-oxoalkanoate reductase
VADGLDAQAIRVALLAARPEVVVHEMTDLKDVSDYRKFDRSFARSNRLRTEGTDHLLAASREAGVRRFVAQSFCGWPYERVGTHVKTELDPLDPDPPRSQQRTLDAIRHLESAVTGNAAMEGIVLRYGTFYGPNTGIFQRTVLDQIRHRRIPMIGGGIAWWSFLHVDDAADATALAVERGERGIYNVADDDPVPVRVWLPGLARLLGAKPPRNLPTWLAGIFAGDALVSMMTRCRAGSNAKAKRILGWRPAYGSWRQGFAALVQQLPHG